MVAGRMLLLAHDMLSPAGLLFLAVSYTVFDRSNFLWMLGLQQLPLSCVLNSRYLTLEHLKALLKHVGFAEVNERWKKGGKMAYWLFRKVEKDDTGGEFGKKVVIRQGNRNNFCILL
jgi:25S rRNA (adenine2142-N1)-methyltransferase